MMKTITYEREQHVPALANNPFIVVASKEISVAERVVVIHTGLKLQLPDGCELRVEKTLHDDLIVFATPTLLGELILLAISLSAKQYDIVPGTKIAQISVVQVTKEAVRYVEMADGKRKMCGDSSSVSFEQSQ